jgi:hypothetical protein
VKPLYKIRVASGPDDAGSWYVQVRGPFGIITMCELEARHYADELELGHPDLAPVAGSIRKAADRCACRGVDA